MAEPWVQTSVPPTWRETDGPRSRARSVSRLNPVPARFNRSRRVDGVALELVYDEQWNRL